MHFVGFLIAISGAVGEVDISYFLAKSLLNITFNSKHIKHVQNELKKLFSEAGHI